MQRRPLAPCQQSQFGVPMGGSLARGQMLVRARGCRAVRLPEAADYAEMRISQCCARNIQNFTISA